MDRLLGLGTALALLTLASACDPGIDPFPLCNDGVAREVDALEDPEAHERAAEFAIAGTASLRDDRTGEAVVAVEETLLVEVIDHVCGDGFIYSAEVTVSLTVGEELQLTLPASLGWEGERESLTIDTGPIAAADMVLPYEAPQGWILHGVDVRGGCSKPVVVEAWLVRDTCTDLENCAETTFVEVAQIELPYDPDAWSCGP